MVTPDAVPFVVPADVANVVRAIEADIDRALLASGVAEKSIDDSHGGRVVESIRRIYSDAGLDVHVDTSPSCQFATPGLPWLHCHVYVRKRESPASA